MGFEADWRSLVCAACAHPVVDGRCPSCRGIRDELQRSRRDPRWDWAALAAALVLVLVAVLAQH